MFLRAITAMLYPNRCIFCGRLTASDVFHCPECDSALVRCKTRPKLYEVHPLKYCDAVCSVYRYNNTSKHAVFRLKFQHDKSVAAPIAREMSKAAEHYFLTFSLIPKDAVDVVIPVPMHRTHERKRGYNQSALLAERISKILDIPYSRKLLYKIKLTRKQHDISFRDRKDNLHDAFFVPSPAAVKGKRILLVDDVCTSGNTFTECAMTLKKAGVESVYCVSFLNQSSRYRAFYLQKEWEQGKYKINKV